MTMSPATTTPNEPSIKELRNVTITGVFRNLPDEKCLELRTDQGLIFYFQSLFNPLSETTVDSVQANGKNPQISTSMIKGNFTTNVMEALFRALPSNIPKPVFQ